MEFFLSGVVLMGNNFTPVGFVKCDGAILSISQHQSLFSLLGSTFGGDGRTTFGIPNLEGRVPMGFGRGIGLPLYFNGDIVGNTINSLTEQQMPTHTHAAAFHPSSTPGGTASVSVSLDDATSTVPLNGGYLAKVVKGGGAADKDEKIYRPDAGTKGTVLLGGVSGDGTASGGTVEVGNTGGGSPFSIMQPSIAMNYVMSTNGIYPSRS